MLKDTSSIISQHIKDFPDNLNYHLNIEDKNNILEEIYKVYQGETVVIYPKDYKEFKNINKSEIKFIILSGITGGSSWLLYYKALQDGVTSAVAAIDKLSLLVAIILSYFIFNEKMNKKTR